MTRSHIPVGLALQASLATMACRAFAIGSVVFVAGQPIGRPGTTNLLKLHRVGESR